LNTQTLEGTYSEATQHLSSAVQVAEVLVPDDASAAKDDTATSAHAMRYAFVLDSARCIIDVRQSVESGASSEASVLVDRALLHVDTLFGVPGEATVAGGSGNRPGILAGIVPNVVMIAVRDVLRQLRAKVVRSFLFALHARV
jgi:hypothetical protein